MLKLKNISKNRNYGFKIFNILPFKKEIIRYLNYQNLKRLNKIKTPENIIFFVTNKCNARCQHCFYWKSLNKESNELSIEEIKQIVKSLKNRIDTLLITGGEPFLRKDLYEIIELFVKINRVKKIHITSNGSTPEKILELSKRVLNNLNVELSVQISIDGDEDYHDKLRGVRGIYNKAILTLKLLKNLESDYPNFILGASTTLTKFNQHQIDSISNNMKRLGVTWHFQLVRASNYGIINLSPGFIADYKPKDESVILPTINEIKKIIEKYFPKNNDLRNIIQEKLLKYSLLILNNVKPTLKCRAGKTDGIIYSNGDVSLCEVTKSFDNLRNHNLDFYRLWTSEKADMAREKIKACSCIHPCHLINSMKYDYKVFLDRD